MKLAGKIVIGILAAIGVLYVGLMVTTNFIYDCYNERVDFIISPSGDYQIESSKRVCEEEISTITVWIQRKNSNIKTAIFQSPLTSNQPLKISWTGSKEVIVNYPKSQEPTNYGSNFEDVYIKYKMY